MTATIHRFDPLHWRIYHANEGLYLKSIGPAGAFTTNGSYVIGSDGRLYISNSDTAKGSAVDLTQNPVGNNNVDWLYVDASIENYYGYLRTAISTTAVDNADLLADLGSGRLGSGDFVKVANHYVATAYGEATSQGASLYEVMAGAAPTNSIGITVPIDAQFHLLARPEKITPYLFGVVGAPNSNTANDSAALQRFFDYIGSVDQTVEIDWSCDIGAQVQFTLDLQSRRIDVRGRLNIKTLFTSVDSVLILDNANYCQFDTITIEGGNPTAYVNRQALDGIDFRTVGRCTFNLIEVNGVKRWGLRHNPNYNNSGNTITTQRYLNCGTRSQTLTDIRGVTANFTVGARSGSNGSSNQIQTVTVDALPDGLEEFSHLMIGSTVYTIMQVIGNDLELYPWIPVAETETQLKYINGGGVNLHGNDSNLFQFDLIDAIGCAKGIKDTSNYGSVGGVTIAQNCTVHLQLGDLEGGSSTTNGYSTQAFYTELDVDVPLLIGVTSSSNGESGINANIGVTHDTDVEAFVNCSVPLFNESPSLGLSGIYGVKFQRSGVEYSGQATNPRNFASTSIQLRPGPDEISKAAIYANNQTVVLRKPVGANYLSYYTVELLSYGTGVSEQPTGTYTFQTFTGDGTTVMGAASATFSDFTKPPIFIGYLRGNDWHVMNINASQPLMADAGGETVNTPAFIALMPDPALYSIAEELVMFNQADNSGSTTSFYRRGFASDGTTATWVYIGG